MRLILLGVSLATSLAVVAWASPDPDRVTDRGVYEATAERVIVPDCSDLHCFRVLVPWILGRLPGSSTLRWKAYAVICNTAAAIGVFALCSALASGRRTATLAAVVSAFGFGSLYTLHDPYTSDPLMFALGPILTSALVADRVGIATIAGAIGVMAKEFAAAPLYLVAGAHVLARRFSPALRALAGANVVFIVWIVFTLTLMLRFNYSWGGTDSAKLSTGAGLGAWLQRLSVRGALLAMFNEFGALYILAPVGLLLASRELRRLAVVSIPIAAVFAYVQQPDRALWNFHFIVVPLAAIVLARVPAPLAWSTVALFAIGNLRVGAQLPMSAISRVAIVGSLALAAFASAMAVRRPAHGSDVAASGAFA